MSIQVRSNEPVAPSQPKASEGESAKQPTQSAPEADASEQNEAPESDTDGEASEVTEDHEEDEGKTDSDHDESEESKEEASKDKPKKKSGFQRRVDKLNARNTATQQELEYWKQQALKGASEPKNATEAKADKNPVTADAAKPIPDAYDTHAEYVEAIADWKAEQKLKERDRSQEQSRLKSEQERAMKAHVERVKSFAEKTTDWSDAMESLEDVPRSAALDQIIIESDNGPALLYELAKDPEEAKRIAQLPPLALAREMGKIEARLAKASDGSSPKPKTITKAPKPLNTVSASGKGVVGKSLHDPNLSQADYERLRKEQMKRRNA